MIEKIKKAAIEGVLLTKSIHFILIKLPNSLLKKIDWVCGCIARFLYVIFTKENPKQIMFISFQGDYTCNPKYIFEELQRRNTSYEFVFSARKKSINTPNGFPEHVRLVEQYSAEYYQEIAKSKIIIANSVEFLKKPVIKRSTQILIETWHGSLGIKRFDAKVNSGRSWVSAAKRCGKYADFIISNSSFESEVYRNSFWSNTPILEYGHPRNDLFFLNENNSLRNELIRKKVFGCNKDNMCDYRFVLYAPTFRDDHNLSYYELNFDKLIQALSERFGGNWCVLVRLHPTIRKSAEKMFFNNKNVMDVTSYPDIQELMLIAEVAITDYSSWIYDYILTSRPGFIFATDITSYVTERGFYYPLSSTPFSIATNNDDLIENILSFDEKVYKVKLEAFLKEKGCIEDGNASKRIVDKILKLMREDK